MINYCSSCGAEVETSKQLEGLYRDAMGELEGVKQQLAEAVAVNSHLLGVSAGRQKRVDELEKKNATLERDMQTARVALRYARKLAASCRQGHHVNRGRGKTVMNKIDLAMRNK